MNIAGFIKESRRVFTLAKKPNREEFNKIAKITGVGIIIIGIIGFLIKIAAWLISRKVAG
ncbi:MAG: protein translocase SEC61 complex subunit gamma [Methanobacteriota archaeon]|nr:MAG: protein translocase SEC61 complex subunit gamma [Euryarchaeota archaeon]